MSKCVFSQSALVVEQNAVLQPFTLQVGLCLQTLQRCLTPGADAINISGLLV